MPKSDYSNIFNYDFNWDKPSKDSSNEELKDDCCEKYKKKGEKKCKKCPNKKVK